MADYAEIYYKDNAKKLYGIVDRKLRRYGGLSNADYDSFYVIATDVFVQALQDYDESIPFENFLKVRLYNKISTEIRDRNRFKRSNTRPKRDGSGNIIRDDNGKIQYDFVQDASLDESIGENESSLSDIIHGDFDMGNKLSELNNDYYSENFLKYLDKLSTLQKKEIGRASCRERV